MPVTVSQIQTVLTADTSKHDASLKRSEKSVNDYAEHSKKQLDTVRLAVLALGQSMVQGLVNPIIALGKASVDAAVRMDSLKRGLTAVAGSSEKAAEQLARLKEVAKLPGLGFEEAIQGSIRLQAAGYSARQAEASLRAFGNALATVGKGKAELDGVSLALSQIASKGKVLAEEINQIAERVPQVREIMKKAFGTADTEILQQAKITSAEFVEIITNELNKLPQVTGGLQNAFENAKDSINQSLTRIGDAIAPLVAMFLDKVVPAIEKMTRAFSELPKETQNLVLAIGALTIAGGPLLLITAQIIELGKAIGLARLAALGPVAGISAVIGAGALAGLSLWNADSDKKAAAAGTTFIQDMEAKLEAYRNDKSPRTAEGEAEIARVRKALDNSYRAEAVRQSQAASKAELAGIEAQAVAEARLADARRRIAEAQGKAARAAAEKAAREAEAEAKRIAKINEDMRDRINELTLSRYDYERGLAKKAKEDAIKDGGDRILAYKRMIAEFHRINQEEAVRAQESVKQSVFEANYGMRRGIDSLSRGGVAGDVSIELPDSEIIRRNTQLGRPDRSAAIITDPEGNKRAAQAEDFARDMVRAARRASRGFISAILGDERDRGRAISGFIDNIKNGIVEALTSQTLNLQPLFEKLALSLKGGLIDAVSGAIQVAQSGIGQLLGAVYQLLSAVGRKGGLNIGSVLGGIAGFALGGFGGAAFGANAGGALYSGDLGGAAAATLAYGATGGFGKYGMGGSSGGWAGNTTGGHRSAQVNYNGPVYVNERADIDRVARETVRRMDLALAAGTV